MRLTELLSPNSLFFIAVCLFWLVGFDATSGKEFQFDFAVSDHGWTAGFADYPVGEDESYELEEDYRPRPGNLGSDNSWFVSGNNHSDDLFMFLKKEVKGLAPSTAYDVEIDVEFASEIPAGLVGIGGAPAESVHVKVGATAEEPVAVVTERGQLPLGFYEMNIDKGNQANSGEDAIIIGNIAKPSETPGFELVSLMTTEPLSTVSNVDGSLWLMVGTDSGFEGTTDLYYTQVSADFTVVPEPSSATMLLLGMFFGAVIRRRLAYY